MVNDHMDKNHLARDEIYAFFIQNNRWKATLFLFFSVLGVTLCNLFSNKLLLNHKDR